MEWDVVAMIMFSAVAVNHLELIMNIEKVIKHSLPVVNCPKCLSFWSVLIYGMSTVTPVSPSNAIASLSCVFATALLCAYLAIWLELLMGYVDTLYDRIYEQIYPTADSAADDAASSACSVPEMWIDFGDSSDSSDSGQKGNSGCPEEE